jgi:hypothetical protein
VFNRAETRLPVAAFSLPPNPPKGELTEAIQAFERVAESWGALRGEIADTKEEAERAKIEARAATEAALAGKETKVSVVAVEQEFAAKIAELEGKEEALRQAVDESGNAMALQIAEHKSAWIARLGEVEAEQAARFAKAISEALGALSELASARGAVEYLRDFNHTLAKIGQQRQFSGGRIEIEHRIPGTVQTHWDPAVLLKALNEVVDPTPKPQPVKSRAVPA